MTWRSQAYLVFSNYVNWKTCWAKEQRKKLHGKGNPVGNFPRGLFDPEKSTNYALFICFAKNIHCSGKMKILSIFCWQVLCNHRHRITSAEPIVIEIRSLSVNIQVCIKFNTGAMVKQKQTRTIGLNPFCTFHINVENFHLTLTQRNANIRCKSTFMHVLQYSLVSPNLCWLLSLFQFRPLSLCCLWNFMVKMHTIEDVHFVSWGLRKALFKNVLESFRLQRRNSKMLSYDINGFLKYICLISQWHFCHKICFICVFV